jgi:Ca2+-binding EF-hand superfamily protein
MRGLDNLVKCSQNPITFKALANLKKFKSTCKLRSALEGFILYHLGKNKTKEDLEQAFKVLDTDGTGTLDIGEIRQGF